MFNLRNNVFIVCLGLLIVIMLPSFSETDTDKPKEQTPNKFIPENKRARLKEARECTKTNPGTSWLECRHGCAELCNEIVESYERGVCNGVVIQTCCGQHPTGCK